MLIPSAEPELLKSRGPLGTFGVALALMLTHWRELLAVLLPVLVPLLVLRHLMADELITRQFPVYDSGPVAAVMLLGWCVAVVAAILVAAGGMRGIAVRWTSALARSLRVLFNTVVSAFLATIVIFGGLTAIVAMMSRTDFTGLGLLMLGVLSIPVIAIAARIVLTIPDGAIKAGGVATLTTDRFLAANGSIFVGGALIPWAIGSLGGVVSRAIGDSQFAPGDLPVPLAVLGVIIEDTALIVAIALQATTLAVVYLQRHSGPGASADLVKVNVRLAGMARGTSPSRPGRRLGAVLVAGITIPALVAGAAAQLNFGQRPSITAHDVSSGWDIETLAWPAGQHPVIVTDSSVHWCLDDECSRYKEHHRNIFGVDPTSLPGIGRDRSVAMAVVSGRGNNDLVVTDGNDAVRLELCTAPGVCDQGITKWHTGGDDGRPHLAAMPGRDGSIVVATAYVPDEMADDIETGSKPGQVRIGLTRCPTVHCTSREYTDFGTVPASLDITSYDSDWTSGITPRWQRQPEPLLELRIDDRNAPTVLLRDPSDGKAWIGSCDSPTCGDPALTDAPWSSDAAWPGAWLDQLPGSVTLEDGRLRFADLADHASVQLGHHHRRGEGAITVTARGIYAVLIEDQPRPSGLRPTIGPPPPPPTRLVLWHCPDLRCEQPVRTPLWEVDRQIIALKLTADADGQVLIVYNDTMGSRAVLITP